MTQRADRGEGSPDGDGTVRETLRPGLVLVRRRILKEDGRYLYHYEFDAAGESLSPPVAEEAE